ncbi:hypothetical protein [Haloarchaeobius sp. HRN-SO-5]|uniref:hypothetical protein n=1 Tax=Haloarchaeobius sp. HRN-SO-5 TaxID=3446118 RepID=UPI003EBF534E
MEKFTLLELHFDGEASFSPNIARRSSEEASEEPEQEFEVDVEAEEEEAESTGTSPLAILVGIVALAVLGAGVRRLLGGEAETDEYEPEMVEIEE